MSPHAAFWSVLVVGLLAFEQNALATEAYVPEPMPPGVHVEATDLDGPVFADSQGHTLYRWEVQSPAEGGKSICGSERLTVSSIFIDQVGGPGLYPETALPEPDLRPSCAEAWPPLLAADDATAVGKWTITTGPKGIRQWAYEGYPVTTSHLDTRPGDVFGGTVRWPGYAYNTGRTGQSRDRTPIGPTPDVPPGFKVISTQLGRLLLTSSRMSVYVSDGDSPGKSNCTGPCTDTWVPMYAPRLARGHGEWSTIDRGSGIKQWAFAGKPLYWNSLDTRHAGLEGTDVVGWKAALVHAAPPPPAGITIQQSPMGEVMADRRGRTVYIYNCIEPTLDYLACDYPAATQAYRLAYCGNGDVDVCLKRWPLVPAAAGATSTSRLWSVLWINPRTGHAAKADDPGAMRVWAYRNRPIYTYYKDKEPGDLNGDGIGEVFGSRNGWTAIRFRDSLYPSAFAD